MKVSYERNGHEYAIDDVEKLPPKSVEYLIGYGYRKSLQDCVAGDEKRIRDEMLKLADEAGEPVPTEETIRAEIEVRLAEAFEARRKAILDGTVGDRAGVVRDPFGTTCKAIAMQMLRDACRATNTKMPKDDKLKEVIAALLEKRRDFIEKEAHRRLKPSKDTVDLQELGL